jgi:hypothetical protein
MAGMLAQSLAGLCASLAVAECTLPFKPRPRMQKETEAGRRMRAHVAPGGLVPL